MDIQHLHLFKIVDSSGAIVYYMLIIVTFILKSSLFKKNLLPLYIKAVLLKMW